MVTELFNDFNLLNLKINLNQNLKLVCALMLSNKSSGSTFRYFSTSYYTIISCLASFSESEFTNYLSFFLLSVEIKLPF